MADSPARSAKRIVSLVPSVTESLFCLAAARNGRIHLIDGTLVSWYGLRIEPAIATIRTRFFD